MRHQNIESVLSYTSKGYVGSVAHGTLFLKMIHLTHALLHTQTLSLLSPQTLLGRMIFLQLCRYPHDLFFSVSCLSLGNRHHLFTPFSSALILCHPAFPNIQSPSLNNCSKVIDCAYTSFFVVLFMFCQQMSLKYCHCCLNTFSFLCAITLSIFNST